MASEEKETPKTEVSENTLIGLSMLGGAGVVMMIVAAAVGVVLPEIDSGIVSLFTLLGAGLLAAGIGGWVIAARPLEQFDDISVPHYHGHHHEEHHEEDSAASH